MILGQLALRMERTETGPMTAVHPDRSHHIGMGMAPDGSIPAVDEQR